MNPQIHFFTNTTSFAQCETDYNAWLVANVGAGETSAQQAKSASSTLAYRYGIDMIKADMRLDSSSYTLMIVFQPRSVR